MSKEEGLWTFRPEDWRDAMFRLEMMEYIGQLSRDGKGPLKMRIVTPVQRPPVLLPARIGDILYGPDGKPIKETI
jgi:hypothetical protein